MKKLLTTLTAFGALLLFTTAGQTADFPVDVNIPAATSLSFTLYELTPGQPFPTSGVTTPPFNLDWSQAADLSLDPTTHVFTGTHYYAIDVAPSGGAGQPNVLVQWQDTANPNGSPGDGTGLDVKGVATVVSVNPATDAETTLKKADFENINNTTITATQLASVGYSGFMRMYVGLATGDPASDPSGAVPFTTGDKPGTYSGTITISVAP